jgi:hypothetical protein
LNKTAISTPVDKPPITENRFSKFQNDFNSQLRNSVSGFGQSQKSNTPNSGPGFRFDITKSGNQVTGPQNAPSVAEKSAVKLNTEQTARVRKFFKNIELSMAKVFSNIRKVDSQFSVSLKYEVKISKTGKGDALHVHVVGEGSTDSKNRFKNEFESLLTQQNIGNDLAEVIVRGEKVFIN